MSAVPAAWGVKPDIRQRSPNNRDLLVPAIERGGGDDSELRQPKEAIYQDQRDDDRQLDVKHQRNI